MKQASALTNSRASEVRSRNSKMIPFPKEHSRDAARPGWHGQPQVYGQYDCFSDIPSYHHMYHQPSSHGYMYPASNRPYYQPPDPRPSRSLSPPTIFREHLQHPENSYSSFNRLAPYSFSEQTRSDARIPAERTRPTYYHNYQEPPVQHIYVPDDAERDQPSMSTSEPCVDEISDLDVLCGRGSPSSWHPGNQHFRGLVSQYQSSYLAARRANKPEIAMRIVKMIKLRGGRFLKRTKVHGTGPSGHFSWQDIGEQRAYEKTCQALREGAPEIRRKLAAKERLNRESYVKIPDEVTLYSTGSTIQEDSRDDV